MPVLGVTTPIEFATDEWAKLARAWRYLNPTDKDRAIQAHLDQLRDHGKLRIYPEIPGWDDILKTGRADETLTAAELAARRKKIRARIQQSVTPAHQKAVASVLNAIDDVQDLASFAGLLARLVLRAAPRVGARFVPIVGWIATASDVLNFLGFLTMTAGAALGLHHEGPLGAVASAAGPAFVKAALKREMWTMLRRNALRRVVPTNLSSTFAPWFDKRNATALRLQQKYGPILGKRVGFSELLEAGQALETLTGYGLSLGAVMGYLSDAAWAVYRDVVGVPHSKVSGLTRELMREAPAEFILVDSESQPKPFYFDKFWNYGPALKLYQKQTNDDGLNGVPLGYYAVDPATKPPWCWLVTWIQHPQYPRIPDSLLYYATTPFGPNHPNASYARSRISQKGGILTIRPTLDGY